MTIKNITRAQLDNALAQVNKKYDDNVIYKDIESLNSKGTRHRLTLRVSDSKKIGARISYYGKRLVSACWHVHGDFFDAVIDQNDQAVIRTGRMVIDQNGGNWQDFNIGSMMYPLYFSEACGCDRTEDEVQEFKQELKSRFA